MAYFVYKISMGRELTQLSECSSYREARTQVRTLRKDAPPNSSDTYRLIFANDSDQAQQLLLEKREPRPMGEQD